MPVYLLTLYQAFTSVCHKFTVIANRLFVRGKNKGDTIRQQKQGLK